MIYQINVILSRFWILLSDSNIDFFLCDCEVPTSQDPSLALLQFNSGCKRTEQICFKDGEIPGCQRMCGSSYKSHVFWVAELIVTLKTY